MDAARKGPMNFPCGPGRMGAAYRAAESLPEDWLRPALPAPRRNSRLPYSLDYHDELHQRSHFDPDEDENAQQSKDCGQPSR
jgi:hypothetical protein